MHSFIGAYKHRARFGGRRENPTWSKLFRFVQMGFKRSFSSRAFFIITSFSQRLQCKFLGF